MPDPRPSTETESDNRVRIVTPNTAPGDRIGRQPEFADRGREVDRVGLDVGPISISSAYEAALATPDTCHKVITAKRDGCDAVVIDCMSDPGLASAREITDIPVLGAAQTAMHVAALLGLRFSVITTGTNAAELEQLATRYGHTAKFASTRTVHAPGRLSQEDDDTTVAALVVQGVAAVIEDGADVILLGSTALSAFADSVRSGLAQRGAAGVPVIEPLSTTVRIAQALVDLGLTHSKRSHPTPPARTIGDGLAQVRPSSR